VLENKVSKVLDQDKFILEQFSKVPNSVDSKESMALLQLQDSKVLE
jgi:hypothetical protein